MKKLSLVLALGAAAWVLPCDQAEAIPFFNKMFQEKYAGEKADPAFATLVKETAKCNICHVEGEKKTVRNDYGEALKKAGLDKATFTADLQKMPAGAQQAQTILEKVAGEKGKSGQTFGDLIKAGKVPGTN